MSVIDLPRNQILGGDALTRLKALPGASIDSVVTSPPYFRLRNYGVSGQLGLEPAIDDWVSELRVVMQEVARVLVPTGSVWLNLGDSFSTHRREGALRKSLLFGPERLALALLDDGWTIRNKIVWAKTTNVPSSVTDRFSTHHELVYLLVRSPRYYFDLDSLREPHTSRIPKPRKVNVKTSRPSWLGPNSDGDGGLAVMHANGIRGHPLGKNPGDVWRLGVSQFRGAHFATFPEHLARRMVEGGTPRMRCSQCRAPWVRRLIREGETARRAPPRPTCTHDAQPEPGIVLDPFIGSGTTAIAAAKLGRDWLGIELNPDYVDIATGRIEKAIRHTTSNRKEVT